MTAASTTTSDGELAQSRLRLKKVFLRTLVLSLTACALVAVVALLIGNFNETTARILSTLGALAVHSGMAMACAHALERQRWPKLSAMGLILFGINFCVLITCIWWPGWFDDQAGRAAVTTAALLGFYVLAIPCADLRERHLRPLLATLGLAICAIAFLMVTVCIWFEPTGDLFFPKATAVASIAAFAFGYSCLLIRVPGGGAIEWLLKGALACLWALAALSSGIIVWEINADFWFRVLGALGVLAASSSLALLILAKLRQVGKVERLESTAARVELRCPRCTTLQVVDAGASSCTSCGLKFRIEIDEPRCAKCDYLLWQLPQRRCPECGTPF
jgi:hypothetical protein